MAKAQANGHARETRRSAEERTWRTGLQVWRRLAWAASSFPGSQGKRSPDANAGTGDELHGVKGMDEAGNMDSVRWIVASTGVVVFGQWWYGSCRWVVRSRGLLCAVNSKQTSACTEIVGKVGQGGVVWCGADSGVTTAS